MNNTQKLLTDAINNKHPISFEYTKKSGDVSYREGNPHVLYILKTKNNEISIRLGIFQISGDTDTRVGTFKDFLFIDDISSLKVFDTTTFIPDSEQYNPNSSRYENVLAKV